MIKKFLALFTSGWLSYLLWAGAAALIGGAVFFKLQALNCTVDLEQTKNKVIEQNAAIEKLETESLVTRNASEAAARKAQRDWERKRRLLVTQGHGPEIMNKFMEEL